MDFLRIAALLLLLSGSLERDQQAFGSGQSKSSMRVLYVEPSTDLRIRTVLT